MLYFYGNSHIRTVAEDGRSFSVYENDSSQTRESFALQIHFVIGCRNGLVEMMTFDEPCYATMHDINVHAGTIL
jgi:hypothetical protein